MLRTLKLTTKKGLFVANRLLGRYREKIFILGDGRSGTTWLMEIVNFDDRYRVLWEPFWGYEFDPPLAADSHFPWPESPGLRRQIAKAFAGSYISRRVTYSFPRFVYQGLLVKDINSHLIVKEILDFVPELRMVFVVRHPFAVAVSKDLHSQTGRFAWSTKPSYFTKRSQHIRSALADQLEILDWVEREGSTRLTRIAVWCILHTLVFAAFRDSPFEIVLYEHLASDPEDVVRDLFRRLGLERRYAENTEAIRLKFRQRSRTTIESNHIEATRQGIPTWQDRWSPTDIDDGLKLLKAFELDFLYGDEHYPKLDARSLQRRLGHDNTVTTHLGGA